jgi:hypothetical protein
VSLLPRMGIPHSTQMLRLRVVAEQNGTVEATAQGRKALAEYFRLQAIAAQVRRPPR